MKEDNIKTLYDPKNGDRWKKYKKAADIIGYAVRQSRLDSKLKERAALISKCATNLQFAESSITGHRRIKKANFCRQRLCPMCQWRLAERRRINFLKIIENLTSSNFLFVTFTVRNCTSEEIRETIYLLLESFYKFYRNKLKKNNKKGFCNGYYRSVEITYNRKNNTYHPHMHVVLAVDSSYFNQNYMKKSEWRRQWQKYLGVDYLPQIEAEKVEGRKGGLANEVCKYVTKPNTYINADDLDLTAEQFELLDRQLRGIKMVSSSGVFAEAARKLKLEDDMGSADLIFESITDDNTDEWKRYWYFFNDSTKEYIRYIS